MAQKIFTRETYKNVKKMDREDMENFINRLVNNAYREGYEQAEKNSITFNLEEFSEKLLCMKGIGKVKADRIVRIVKEMTS